MHPLRLTPIAPATDAETNKMVATTTQQLPTVAKRPRDVRLDFFRGLCLVIIYVAHIWNNPWAELIPARFGFSDATEIFVFCSGMASAVAFGSVFERRGWVIGTLRIAHRCWQVYWSHIATFLIVAAMMVAADRLFQTSGAYSAGLGFDKTLDAHGGTTILGLLTLTYVPDYFNILPMYLVILAMLPIVMAIAAVDKRILTMVLILTWATARAGLLDLPANALQSDALAPETWFFNPFSWQIIFFTGFAFMRGWLTPPPIDERLVWAAVTIVIVAIPLSWHVALEASDTLAAWHTALSPLAVKTKFGVLRYVHFLALAYLAYVASGEHGAHLTGRVVHFFRRLGQQSLAVFMSGLVLSFAASIVLNVIGRDALAVAVVNMGGIMCLVLIARSVAWFKSSPWQGQGRAAPPRLQSQSPLPIVVNSGSVAPTG